MDMQILPFFKETIIGGSGGEWGVEYQRYTVFQFCRLKVTRVNTN